MRILFYLPLARGWMLEHVIEPMIAKLAPLAEVHVMIPRQWIDTEAPLHDGHEADWRRRVQWHPIDQDRATSDGKPSFALTPRVLDQANEIGPDVSLCRSIDTSLPQILPGTVRYIMEASAPPFQLPTHWISLPPGIFDHGLIPDLPSALRQRLVEMISPAWQRVENDRTFDPSWRIRQNLPQDRQILAVPLEYDHPDNSFGIHRSVQPNSSLIMQLADRVDDRFFLAVTDHPLNIQFLDQPDLVDALEARCAKARLLSTDAQSDISTATLTQHSDGMIVGDSKSFSAAAFYGRPLLRVSKFATGSWLNAYDDITVFSKDLAAGKAAAASPEDAQLWFAHYLAVQSFAPSDADVTGSELLERLVGDLEPGRWSEMFERAIEAGICDRNHTR